MEKIFVEHSWILILLVVWSIPWKGAALWRSARRGHTGWFIALLLLNTLAFLDILYIFVFSKMGKQKNQEPPMRQPEQVVQRQNNKFIV